LFLNIFLDILLHRYYFWKKIGHGVHQNLKWSWNSMIFRGGGMMKLIGLVTVFALVCAGCTVSHRSEVIDTDKLGGYASGTYNDKSNGPVGRMAIGGSGFGSGASGAGFGAAWASVETGPPPSGANDFAKAIAMINYSKKLKSIKYDEFGGVIDYEFEAQPMSYLKTTPQQPIPRQQRRSSFGHQPVE
jgi:hypothetical protein